MEAMAEAARPPRPPELDEVLYRLEVLKLERGQWDENEVQDEEQEEELLDQDVQVEEERERREGLAGKRHENQSLRASSILEPGLMPGAVGMPRSGSVTTSPSPHLRSLSPSVASHSTVATSRSSQEQQPRQPEQLQLQLPQQQQQQLLVRSRHASLRASGWPRSVSSTTSYETFLPSGERCRRRRSGSGSGSSTTSPGPTAVRAPLEIPSFLTASHAPTVARKSYEGIKRRFAHFSKGRRNRAAATEVSSCTRCRLSTKKCGALQMLGCEHRYCRACFHQLLLTVMRTAKTVPITCCRQSLPTGPILELLNHEERERFLTLILALDAARRDQASCPRCQAGLIDGAAKSRASWDARCRYCGIEVCKMCASKAHAVGQACPVEWTLEVLVALSPSQGWVRCRQCGLVRASEGCSHITCACNTEICGACGSKWDSRGACCGTCDAGSHATPVEEEDGIVEEDEEGDGVVAPAETEQPVYAIVEPELADSVLHLEQLQTEAKSLAHPELQELRTRQLEEQKRFGIFEQKQKWVMWTRHGQKKVEMLDRHAELEKSMQDKHLETAGAMEDRHLIAEMELRQNLAQEERACLIRLKHMEDYFNPSKANTTKSKNDSQPVRRITERDIRELNRQYHVRDGMSRLHEARINVLRDQQARQLEALEKRQRLELEQLVGRRLEAEVEALEASFAHDEASFDALFGRRKGALRAKWLREEAVVRTKLEERTGESYGPLPSIPWPKHQSQQHPHHRHNDPGHRRRQQTLSDVSTIQETVSLDLPVSDNCDRTASLQALALQRASTAPDPMAIS